MFETKEIEYSLEFVWTDVHRSLMYRSKTQFGTILLGDDITFPQNEGWRAEVTSVRHLLGDPTSDDPTVMHHILIHVKELIPVDDEEED